MIKYFGLSATIIACLTFSPVNQAASQSEVELDYVDVMQGLVEHMQDIIVAIMYEDYSTLADVAENIAYHPGPSADKRMALLHKLGMESITFRLYEDKVRQQALILMKQAKQADRMNILKNYTLLAQACTDCHSSYRSRIKGMNNRSFSPSLFDN